MKPKNRKTLKLLGLRIANRATIALGALGVIAGLGLLFMLFIRIYERPTKEERIMSERMDQIHEYGGVLRLSALTRWPWDKACIIESTYEVNTASTDELLGANIDYSRAAKDFLWGTSESRGAWVFFYKDQQPWAVRVYTTRADKTGDCVTPDNDYLRQN